MMNPTFSVVIPTYNRLKILAEVIQALDQQEEAPEFELIIVNDGSTDGTEEWLKSNNFRMETKILSQRNAGPAAARNAGIEAATGYLIAFLGDDTVPTRKWLAAHYLAHQNRDWSKKLAVIGYTDWHPEIRVTPFLRYINEFGLQFGYALLNNPEEVPFNFFYTSNLSLPAELVKSNKFDVRFPHACWEDIELGYRLKLQGVRIVFVKNAIVYHKHKTGLRSFIRRQENAGFSAVTLFKIHPEIDFLGLTEEGPSPQFSRISYLWGRVLVSLSLSFPLQLPKLWDKVLNYHYIKGLHSGWNRSRDKT